MKSGFVLLAFLASSLLAADKPQAQVQAQLLDSNSYLCANCFFGASTYYYCFEADHKVLIGYDKMPVLNWQDPASNDLAKLHKSWKPLKPEEGQTVQLRYDDKHIWVTANGKTFKLKQDYTTDIFLNNRQCRSAVRKKDQ